MAAADATDALRHFAQDVKSGKAAFNQTVTSPDGAKKKTAAGTFEFLRPNRFRFDYAKPNEQTIVADGQKVWLFDPDLNQVTVRGMDQALGTMPAAILAGGAIEKDFTLQAEPDQGGVQWVQATPKSEGSIRQLRVGFRGEELAVLEILDGFGQRSRLDFSKVETGPSVVNAQRFRYTPPAGADVLK
jgi:outer membrane lipoprotein carrier protein